MHERLNYRLIKPSTAVYPGAHLGQMVGSGQLFKRHAPLIASPDPRRIDLRASVLDPFNSYRVKVYQQQSTINVAFIADLSASMGFQGQRSKQQTLVQLLLAVADAAHSYGDSFGFIGAADTVKPQWLLPSSQALGRVTLLAKQLQSTTLQGSAHALTQVAPFLPASKGLVFLVSDFHWPLAQCRTVLSRLQGHEVVPLVLWDAQEINDWPDWRLVSLQDLESRATRTLLMRPKLREKMAAAYAQRQKDLKNCFRGFGMEPLFLNAGFQVTPINRYFAQRAAA